MEKRPLFIGRIILSFIIATIIFSGGFLTSYMITYSQYKSVSSEQEDIRYDLLSLELEKQLISSSCELLNLNLLSNDLSNMGSIIGILEERFGKRDSRVLNQKKYYSLLEVQHFLLIQENNQKCNQSIPLILFFYSNKQNYIEEAEKMGYILSSLKNKNPETMIYSFDYDLDINIINLLKKKYEINKPNTIILANKKQKIKSFNTLRELENLLSKPNNSNKVIFLN